MLIPKDKDKKKFFQHFFFWSFSFLMSQPMFNKYANVWDHWKGMRGFNKLIPAP